MKRFVAILVLLNLTSFALAATRGAQAAHAPAAAQKHQASEPQPAVPAHPAWARTMLLVIATLFIAAIPIGIMVRANMPTEAPPEDAHDDEHGHH